MLKNLDIKIKPRIKALIINTLRLTNDFKLMVIPKIRKKKVLTTKAVSRVINLKFERLSLMASSFIYFSKKPAKNNLWLLRIRPKTKIISKEERCISLAKSYNKIKTEISRNSLVLVFIC